MKYYVLVYATPQFQETDTKFLIIHKNKPAWQAGRFNLLGGKVENGELPEEAAIRELYEESGYKPYSNESCNYLGNIKCEKEIIYCYRIFVDNTHNIKPLPGETEKVAWVNWNDIKQDERLLPNLRLILPLAMARVYDWTIEVSEDFTDKTYHRLSIELPSDQSGKFSTTKTLFD